MRTFTGPAGVATTSDRIWNRPTATATSRAFGEVKCQLRRPPPMSVGDDARPLASTVSAAGASTVRSRVASSLTAISAGVLLPGVRTQPTPRTQASNGAAVAHQAVSPSEPSRSMNVGGSCNVKSSTAVTDWPAATVLPSGSERSVPAVPGRPPADSSSGVVTFPQTSARETVSVPPRK